MSQLSNLLLYCVEKLICLIHGDVYEKYNSFEFFKKFFALKIYLRDYIKFYMEYNKSF